jgi:Family of unknown function (DUF5343)
MSDKNTGSQSKAIPPYVAFKTFENFLDSLRARVIPSRIDRAVMSTMSGGVQSHLINALRYLEFVTATDQPTELMKVVVQSEGEERRKRLAELIPHAYPFLFENFDLSNVTPRHLEEQFRANTGANGSTLKKCLAFFTNLCKAANYKISPLLKRARGPRANGTRRKPAANGSQPEPPLQQAAPGTQNSEWKKALLEKFPAFDPNWNEEVQARWFAAFERLMGDN